MLGPKGLVSLGGGLQLPEAPRAGLPLQLARGRPCSRSGAAGSALPPRSGRRPDWGPRSNLHEPWGRSRPLDGGGARARHLGTALPSPARAGSPSAPRGLGTPAARSPSPPLTSGGPGSSRQAGAGRHDQVRVGGWVWVPARQLEVRRGRAGGGLWVLGALVSTPARPGEVPGGRWAPRFLPPSRGAWSWAPGSGGGARPSGPARGPGSRPRTARLGLLLLLLLPSFLPRFAASFHFPRGRRGGARGARRGLSRVYCRSDAEGPRRSPGSARRRGTQACGRRAGWLRAAVLLRPRARGMSGHWPRRAPPPRAALRSAPRPGLNKHRRSGGLQPSYQSPRGPCQNKSSPISLASAPSRLPGLPVV